MTNVKEVFLTIVKDGQRAKRSAGLGRSVPNPKADGTKENKNNSANNTKPATKEGTETSKTTVPKPAKK